MRIMLPSILMILAAGWFAACSQDDGGQADGLGMPEEYGTPISFGGEMGDEKGQVMGGAKQRTRAGGLEDKHTAFKLWGYKNMGATDKADAPSEYTYSEPMKVFGGYTITWKENTANTTTDNTHDWSYVDGTQTIKYWDNGAKAYRFMAYAPADDPNNPVVANEKTYSGGNTAMSFSFDVDATNEATAPYISRLWFSNDNYPDYPEFGKAVELSFVKPLCKVRFMFVGEDGQPLTTDDPTVMMTHPGSIKFRPLDEDVKISQKGCMTVEYPLTGEEISEKYSFTLEGGELDAFTEPYEDWGGDPTKKVYATAEKHWYTILPNTEQGAYCISLTVNASPRTAVVPAQYMQWKAGFHYTYVFKISPEDMTFQPQLFTYTKWQAGYTNTTTW